jgi:hypothetical protein
LNKKLNRFDISWVNEMGKQGKSAVSIRKHGYKKALQKAMELRAIKEAERLGVDVDFKLFFENNEAIYFQNDKSILDST